VIATGSSRASRLFRDVMGHFCTGIAIVTSSDDEGPVGLTCQSVASVSLDPPLVLFCGGKESTSLPRILATGRFCINILGYGHYDAALQFAVSGADKFARGGWQLSPGGMPQLEDALARIECSVEVVYPAGDHDIVVGRVESLEAGNDAMPLLFYRSEFRVVGRALSLDPSVDIACGCLYPSSSITSRLSAPSLRRTASVARSGNQTLSPRTFVSTAVTPVSASTRDFISLRISKRYRQTGSSSTR